MIQVLVYTIKQPITGNYLINHTIIRYVRTHNSNQIKREEQRQFTWTQLKLRVSHINRMSPSTRTKQGAVRQHGRLTALLTITCQLHTHCSTAEWSFNSVSAVTGWCLDGWEACFCSLSVWQSLRLFVKYETYRGSHDSAVLYSRISLLSSVCDMELKASLVGAKKVSAPCWFNSSVIPAVWMAPTRRLKQRAGVFVSYTSVG